MKIFCHLFVINICNQLNISAYLNQTEDILSLS